MTARITNSTLAELRRLEQGATAGPWTYENDGTVGGILVKPPVGRPHRHDNPGDAQLIAAARNHLAQLLDEMERLRAGLREACDGWNRHAEGSRFQSMSDEEICIAELRKRADGTP
jgi:hypothetical protein